MNEKRLTQIDLFSGTGGFSLAAGWAGFETIVFCESEPFCQQVLKKHWPGVPIIPDIRDFDGTKYRGAAILTGGFPCPAFSRAGMGGGFMQDQLFYEAVRVIRESQPTWVVFENVEGFTKWADELRAEVKNLGYEWEDAILDARDFGIAQARRRYFAVCVRRGVLSGSQYLRGIQGIEGSDIHGLRPYYPNTKRRWTHTVETKEEWRTIFTSSKRSGNANGIPNRMDRLKALGNAIVPQVAYEIIRGIAEIERSK